MFLLAIDFSRMVVIPVLNQTPNNYKLTYIPNLNILKTVTCNVILLAMLYDVLPIDDADSNS